MVIGYSCMPEFTACLLLRNWREWRKSRKGGKGGQEAGVESNETLGPWDCDAKPGYLRGQM